MVEVIGSMKNNVWCTSGSPESDPLDKRYSVDVWVTTNIGEVTLAYKSFVTGMWFRTESSNRINVVAWMPINKPKPYKLK